MQVYEQFLIRHLHSPKLPKKVIEHLPVPLVESLFQSLWSLVFATDHSQEKNLLLQLFLLSEEMLQFDTTEWVRQEIQQLGKRDDGRLHRYFFEGQLDEATLKTILEHNHYRTDFFYQPYTSKEAMLQQYLISHTITYPLPWTQFLMTLDTRILEDFPQLQRLYRIHTFFEEKKLYDTLSPQLNRPEHLIGIFQKLIFSEFQSFFPDAKIVRPVRELVLVEGATEELLLPLFAKSMGIHLAQEGILIYPAGGKNQVLSLYLRYREILSVPIFVVLDRDAQSIVDEIKPILRESDEIFLLEEGEFEDTYDIQLILETINEQYAPHPRISQEYFKEMNPELAGKTRVQELKIIWKEFQLGDFDKTQFAMKLSESFKPPFKTPAPLQKLISSILNNLPSHDSLEI